MTHRSVAFSLVVLFVVSTSSFAKEWKSGIKFVKPKVVAPGDTDAITGMKPPKGAIVLLGNDMSAFNNGDAWPVENGVATVMKKGVSTKQAFGSCRLHVEFASPKEVRGNGQGRGNSGVFLMGLYELQVLDSYENETYYDGQCGAIYKQSAPLVNACRGPGQWQSYDITFTAPKFDDDDKVTRTARITVLHNGIKIQDDYELKGDTRLPRITSIPRSCPSLFRIMVIQ